MAELGDKLLLPRDGSGQPILAHVAREAAGTGAEVVIAYGREEVRQAVAPFVPSQTRWLKDVVAWQGPLVAIANVFRQFEEMSADAEDVAECFHVVAGDLPGLQSAMLRRLSHRLRSGSSDVAAYVRDGRLQPLIAAYRWHVGRRFIDAVERGETRILRVLDDVAVDPVAVSAAEAWRLEPVHTPIDYRNWEIRRSARETP